MTRLCMVLVVGCLVGLAGCDRENPLGPPSVRFGESVCVQCNMIISDQRWATATIVDGPRGPEPRLFDDFNCQVNYEVQNLEVVILARWSHDYATSQWLSASDATFLMAETLRTPMGSRTAAFADPDAAAAASRALPGDVVPFDIAWERLGYTGAKRHHLREQADGSG